MGDYALYQAIQSYTSDDDSKLEFKRDDLLEISVQSPFSTSKTDKPGWLFAYNVRTKAEGYVPVECVKLVGSKVNNTFHHPSALGVEVSENFPYKFKEADSKTQEHKFDDVYFLTPILCQHCKDYIWGQGHVGVKCKGEFEFF